MNRPNKAPETPEAENDADVFRTAMRGVEPLKQRSGRVSPAGRKPAPHPVQREADERAVLAEMGDPPLELLESGEELSYRAPGIQDSVYRRLKRGAYHIGAELDLHGLNSEAAKLAVVRFLVHCHDRNLRCVRIIHGKGRRSPNSGPVLKTRLAGWLARRKDVLAYCSARPQDGGSGAVYVLLRHMPQPSA